MLKIENHEVVGWEHAIRGMRNPMNSWSKSDSGYANILADPDAVECGYKREGVYEVGAVDFALMTQLRSAGIDHRKFMRMIMVYVDITAPLYWWKEFDTYKVGTVANSCSTMHKIGEERFTLSDFSCEHLDGRTNDGEIKDGTYLSCLAKTVAMLNCARDAYHWCNTDEKKTYWWQMIQLLPSSYNQKRTIMMNYEVLANLYKSRHDHKLDEWHILCDWAAGLPCGALITGE